MTHKIELTKEHPKTRKPVSVSVTFDEVVAMAVCPFCHQEKGLPCLHRKTKKPQEIPHFSRAQKALKIKRG